MTEDSADEDDDMEEEKVCHCIHCVCIVLCIDAQFQSSFIRCVIC